MAHATRKPTKLPAEHQSRRPGHESAMRLKPRYDNPNYKGSGKLKSKVAIITGGDSGIGRATAILFAKEGASLTIVYLTEDEDAEETRQMVEELGQNCILIKGDVGEEKLLESLAA
jgi:predicted ATP-dependent serine protease